jgi:hypothetical protein
MKKRQNFEMNYDDDDDDDDDVVTEMIKKNLICIV